MTTPITLPITNTSTIVLKYKRAIVPDFDTLISQPFDLKSPSRSTVPLLAFWDDPVSRLASYLSDLRLDTPANPTLTFEYTMYPVQGVGNASHTDLMICSPKIAVGTEGKYTEGKYELVSKWLHKGDNPLNKELVLGGWLEVINSALETNLTLAQVENCTYQLIHRAASVCSIDAKDRVVVYHCFDATTDHCKYYSHHLNQLASLINQPDKIRFVLYTSTIIRTAEYSKLESEWQRNKSQNYSAQVRTLLKQRRIASFGQPTIKHHP